MMKSGSRSPKDGVALVIVLIILLSLIALAIPFVASMLFKSRGARNTFYTTQGHYEAEGVRNFAIASLYHTHDRYETKDDAVAPFNTPDYDTPDELKVDLSLPGQLSLPDGSLQNPRGKIWGVDIQDEQGKINIRTAPDSIIRTLRKVLNKKPTFRLSDYLTDSSYCSDDWVGPRQLRGYADCLLVDEKTFVTKLYTNTPVYPGENTRVRLSNGDKQFFAYVMPYKICTACNASWPWPIKDHFTHSLPPGGLGINNPVTATISGGFWNGGTSYEMLLDRMVPKEFISPFTVVEIAQVYPININTASPEVIMANLWGVGRHYYNWIRDPDTGEILRVEMDERVTEDQARQLADLIKAKVKSGGFKEMSDYYNFLSSPPVLMILEAVKAGHLRSNNLGVFSGELADVIEGYFTKTLPFCVRSNDKYTAAATGIINYPSANEAAVITHREVVDVTPPGTNVWAIESQYDFDREFASPYGNTALLTTYPNNTVLGQFEFPENALPDHSRKPADGDLRLKAADDNRANPILTEHFSNTREGLDLNGAPLTYLTTGTNIFAFQNNRDIAPGGIEMWAKVKQFGSPTYFFDIKQREYENQLALWYDGTNLILSASDATVDQKAAQIRAPMVLQPDTWYHFGAYWKGTKYAQLALFVDGKAVGSFAHYNNADQAIITELSTDLTDQLVVTQADGAGLVIPVVSTGPFPDWGVVEIGDEAIEYEAKISSGLRVVQVWQKNPPPAPDTMGYNGRGARGTTVKKHPRGAKVTVYGYANTLRNTISLPGYPGLSTPRLTTGGAGLAQPLVDHMPVVFLCKPEITDGTGKIIQTNGIGPDDTQIPITKTSGSNPDDISMFPPDGYLRMNNEVIFYSGIGTMSVRVIIQLPDGTIVTPTMDVPCFTGCQRGFVGTTAASHSDGAAIELYSLKVTDNSNYLDQTLIQIDNEWFGPVQREGTAYFIGLVSGGRPYTLQRGAIQTNPATHAAGAVLIPVFGVNSPYSGPGDFVTIIDSDQTKDKEGRTINIVRFTNQYLVAFTQNVNREYPIDGSVTRLLKFPSDELPSYLPLNFYIGGPCPVSGMESVSFQGTVDELRFFSTVKGNFKFASNVSATSPASGEAITMNNVSGLSLPSVIKGGDEIIGYVAIDVGQRSLLKCQRGFLSSPAQVHDPCDRVMQLAFLPVGVLTADVLPDDYAVTQTTQSRFMPEGYILVDNEVIGYCWNEGSRVTMPYDRAFRGIYRGAFGTAQEFHKKNTLTLAIPFRYFDRYKAGAFDTSMAYFQGATKLLNAQWQRLRWDDNGSVKPGVRIKLLARFNGQPAWDTVPTNKEGGIFEFTTPDAANRLDVRAEQMELLAFFEYQPGAYNSNDWKYTPILRGIWTEYEKPNLIITHQEE